MILKEKKIFRKMFTVTEYAALMLLTCIKPLRHSKSSILQYFWPALSDDLVWKPIFSLFVSGPFTQVLLYIPRLELGF